MLRVAKKVSGLLVIGAIGLAAQSALGFALLGPEGSTPGSEPFEVPVIGYNLPGDIGAPHNIGEGYRRNVPILYYSCSQSFVDFFKSNGVAAIDQAFGAFNNLTNVSAYTPDLSEFPNEAERMNYQANALSLRDLKSDTMSLISENMGLDQPTRWVWCLHDRDLEPNTQCPAGEIYTVIQRNFSFMPGSLTEFPYSSYVNGTLYTYEIAEACTGPNPLADAVEVPVDPLADVDTAVADFGLLTGDFYTSLTRDDVAGLRYMLQTNNLAVESTGPGTIGFFTNTMAPTPIVTQDLGLLAAEARTNSDAQLMALFPGLIDTSTVVGFQYVTNYNVSFLITLPPTAPAGTFTITPVTNTTVSYIPVYSHTFANVITNTFATHSFYSIQTVSLTNNPLAPPGSPPIVKTTTKNFISDNVSGDFYLLPTNVCAVQILSNILTTVVATTNSVVATNSVGVTNIQGAFFSQSTITYFTNHVLAYVPISCPDNPTEDYQGVERVRFIHIPDNFYDSLLGQYRYPVTNEYTMIAEDPTNHVYFPVRVRRVVTQPDFVMEAEDLATTPGDSLSGAGYGARSINFNETHIQPPTHGPGTIETPTSFTYDKVGPIYAVGPGGSTNAFLTQLSQAPIFAWASFDGTTNPPVVYPNGSTLSDLENASLLGILTPNLPVGVVNEPYSAQLQAGGTNPPFTWALAPTSPGLPPGLSLSPDGVISGTPGGSEGVVYDFVVQLSDSAGHSTDVPLTITIN